MKLRQANQATNVAAAQIIGLSGTHVTVKTESGRILRLPLSKNNQHDRVFMASLRDIWKSKIWIPVNTRFRRLFRTDWLVDPIQSDD